MCPQHNNQTECHTTIEKKTQNRLYQIDYTKQTMPKQTITELMNKIENKVMKYCQRDEGVYV